jgi:hypothetical protein
MNVHLTALAPRNQKKHLTKGRGLTMEAEWRINHLCIDWTLCSVVFARALALGVNSAIFNVGGLRSMQIDYVTAVDGRFKLGQTGFERSAIGSVSPEV